ncbi:MAG TPA: hypothetical protein VKP30_14335 [Polyangiaceae bacterium]|nr:hypothetical protein [Polyangiaceae bacterium]
MNHKAFGGLALVGTLFWLGSAQAGVLIDSSAGVKALAGADLWSTPSNVPEGQLFGFAGSAAGLSYGALGYYELRLIKFVGLEVDLAYQHGSFHRKLTVNQIAEFTETANVNSLRLPILAKLNIPMGVGRFWLGLGPEFTLYQSSSFKLEQTGGPSTPVPGSTHTRNVKPTYGTLGVGFVLEIPLIGIDIPIELRASKNLAQPGDWDERMSVDRGAATATLRAESSWVLRLGAGVGIRF